MWYLELNKFITRHENRLDLLCRLVIPPHRLILSFVLLAGPRLPVIMYREGEPLSEIVDYLTADNGKPQSVEVS